MTQLNRFAATLLLVAAPTVAFALRPPRTEAPRPASSVVDVYGDRDDDAKKAAKEERKREKERAKELRKEAHEREKELREDAREREKDLREAERERLKDLREAERERRKRRRG